MAVIDFTLLTPPVTMMLIGVMLPSCILDLSTLFDQGKEEYAWKKSSSYMHNML